MTRIFQLMTSQLISVAPVLAARLSGLASSACFGFAGEMTEFKGTDNTRFGA